MRGEHGMCALDRLLQTKGLDLDGGQHVTTACAAIEAVARGTTRAR